jgi:hypothetical protein
LSEVPGKSVVNPACPSTRDALIPVVNGALNSRTLAFAASATQRFPEESKAIPPGKESPLELVAFP